MPPDRAELHPTDTLPRGLTVEDVFFSKNQIALLADYALRNRWCLAIDFTAKIAKKTKSDASHNQQGPPKLSVVVHSHSPCTSGSARGKSRLFSRWMWLIRSSRNCPSKEYKARQVLQAPGGSVMSLVSSSIASSALPCWSCSARIITIGARTAVAAWVFSSNGNSTCSSLSMWLSSSWWVSCNRRARPLGQ